MRTMQTTDPAVFLGLSLDEELLRVEFEAIIAAEFPDPQPPRIISTRCLRRRPPLPGGLRDPSTPQPGRATTVGRVDGSGRGRAPPVLDRFDENKYRK